MKKIDSLLLAAVGALLLPAAQAAPDEQRVLAALRKAHPQTRFSGVTRTPVAGLYEVAMGANVAYVAGSNPRYLLFGHLWDARAMRDLTAPRLAQASTPAPAADNHDDDAERIAWAQLPLADAIQRVKGNGSRALAVFSDPACTYCQRLEAELERLDHVTLYTFLVPFQGAALPAAIWCAADRAGAWQQVMLAGDTALPAPDTPCASPLERNLALARQLGVRGTPTLLFADGRRLDGYHDAAAIEAKLAAAAQAFSATAPRPAPLP